MCVVFDEMKIKSNLGELIGFIDKGCKQMTQHCTQKKYQMLLRSLIKIVFRKTRFYAKDSTEKCKTKTTKSQQPHLLPIWTQRHSLDLRKVFCQYIPQSKSKRVRVITTVTKNLWEKLQLIAAEDYSRRGVCRQGQNCESLHRRRLSFLGWYAQSL